MVDAYGIHLGPLYIRFYALILIGGMMAAAWLTARRAPAHGLDADHVWNGLMWAIIPGLIGARIYHILTPSPASGFTLQYYLDNPLQMLAIWNGGLGIYGAIAGGVVGLLIYGARHRQPILRWFDVIVPGVALAQAIGRWGNFINHELYGAPTTLPWAIYIPPEARMSGYAQFETFHPLFLYESLWNLGACLLLIFLHRRFGKWLRPGDLFLIYLAQYPIIRFLLDFLRLDSHLSGDLTTAQIVSLAVCAAALAALALRRLRPAAARQPAEAER